MMIGAGIFLTSSRWVIATVLMLVVTWVGAVLITNTTPMLSRESLMLVSSVFGAFFFYTMRVRSARRLGEHQLMERKYKESLEEALEQIETLSGLLPICANCKSIRTNDGEWTRIEEYVRERSDVEFTHSICPGCQHELYPEMEKG